MVWSSVTSLFPGHRLWLDDGASQRLVAREGDQVPGRPIGEQFATAFDPIHVNRRGNVVFNTFTDSDGPGPDFGRGAVMLYRDETAELTLLARAEEPVPGTERTIGFVPLQLAINEQSQVVFPGRMSGGLDQGLWVTDRSGQVHNLFVEDEPFEVAPGDVRLVGSHAVAVGNDSERRENQFFNDRSELVFSLSFDDGPNALLVATIDPAPAPVCLCDLNDEGGVDILDLLLFVDRFLRAVPEADLNGDNGVSIVDLLEFLTCWLPANLDGDCDG